MKNWTRKLLKQSSQKICANDYDLDETLSGGLSEISEYKICTCELVWLFYLNYFTKVSTFVTSGHYHDFDLYHFSYVLMTLTELQSIGRAITKSFPINVPLQVPHLPTHLYPISTWGSWTARSQTSLPASLNRCQPARSPPPSVCGGERME